MTLFQNRAQRRAAKSYLEKQRDKWPEHLVEIPEEEYRERAAPDLLKVFRSREFMVQIYEAPRPAFVRLSINRTALDGDRWKDGISWEEMQRLKSECGFGDLDAVEVYPRNCDVVNAANMRHLWVLPDLLPFAWGKGR